MRTLPVEARNDDSRAEGGHVVLLFSGLEPPAGTVRFILRPLDSHVDPDRLDELAEPQEAVDCAAVEGGTEIVLGPQTTSHVALETGSSVAIELVGLDAKGEFVWPVMAPPARPRRAGLQIKKVGSARQAPASGDARPPRPQPTMIRPAATTAATAGSVTTSEPGVPATSQAGESLASARRPAAVRLPPRAADRSQGAPPAPIDEVPGEQAASVRDAGADYVVFYPHARGGNLKQSATGANRRRASLLPSTPGGAALTTAVAMLGVVGLMSIANPASKPAVATSAVTQLPPTAAVHAARQPADTQPDLSLFDLLSPGTTSPRGAPAKDVTPQKALENAQAAFLTAGVPRDPEEGAFWLRRYLASIGTDERTRRALTQLGSAYADSSNKSFDFAKARQVWELASAFGDPVAMCFLGVLHENGLAGPVDRKLSLTWFERAKTGGGCPGIDEAIARVKQ